MGKKFQVIPAASLVTIKFEFLQEKSGENVRRQEHLDFIGSIQKLEEKLAPQFIRVHRAYLVRGDQIDQVNLKTREAVLKNGERCPFSRNMRQRLLDSAG